MLDVNAALLEARELTVASDHRGLGNRRDPGHAEQRRHLALVHDPAADSDGSSSCSASMRPASRWYWSALRITPAERTGSPSSVKPAAPTSASSAISVSSSPRCPTVIAARKPVGIRASARARSRSERSTGAESTTGSVLGWARIAQ